MLLAEENILASAVSLYKLLKKLKSWGPSKIVEEETLVNYNELTARKLHNILGKMWPDVQVSLARIKHAWKYDLGWIHTRPKYCQHICAASKDSHLMCCKERLAEKDIFKTLVGVMNVLFIYM